MIALVLERLTAGRGLTMALLLIPWSMITVINAELWGYIYQGTYGVADAILNAVGLGHPNILGTPTPAIVGLMIADIWKTTPFVAILVLAGLVMLPGDIYEAAEVDGSSGWSTFWRITVPLLRAHPGAGRDVPRAAGVRAVRLALRADQRRPGHVDELAGHPGLQRDLQEPLVRSGRGGRHHHRAPGAARVPALAADLPGPGREGRSNNAQPQADRLAPVHQRRQHLGVLRRPVRRAAVVLADRLQLQDAGQPGRQPAAVLPEPDQHRQLHRRVQEQRLRPVLHQLAHRDADRHGAGADPRHHGRLRARAGCRCGASSP